MIGYVTLGTNDLQKAAAFHDELIGAFGGKRMMENETFIAWSGPDPKGAGYALTKPFNGEAASTGNGTMVALACDGPETVNRMHKKAMELGASDEGPPGPRGDDGFYAGYFRDPDNNKFAFFCMS